jgi:hypothetical protein
MAVILTNKGEEILVDDCDYERLCEFCWNLNAYGYARTEIKHNGKWKSQLMHRMIMDVTDSKIYVDHINNKPADNRRSNLRLCTNAENQRNTKVHKDSQSGIKGLFYDKHNNQWTAHICLNGKTHKKSFTCKKYNDAKEKAIKWLEDNRAKLHGEFLKS